MMNVKKLGCLLAFFMCTPLMALADNARPPLDEITFVLTQQAWAKTDTANVTVAINAALDKTSLTTMRGTIMNNLNKIAPADWHLVQFQRSQDSSGLEKLSVEAEARVKETALNTINAQALSVSKPGSNYKIQSVDFTPTIADVEKIKQTLRDALYQQINTEIALLNKTYSTQKYMLHGVRFTDYAPPHTQMLMQVAAPRAMAEVATTNTVSQMVTLTAEVDIASERTSTV